MNAYEIRIKGIVQGVGFRPFVYKLAINLNINGFVKNDEEGVYILCCCHKQIFDEFINEIKENPPLLAKIHSLDFYEIKTDKNYTNFTIEQSINNNNKTTLVSPDISICEDCIEDILDENNFRYEYALTNCTNCGPRYSIIKTVPYDRINTSMAEFKLCKTCEQEYKNPLNRRYHAQPIACNTCGPNLTLYDNQKNIIAKDSLVFKELANLLNEGNIIALKGIGGFHIICDASNENAIQTLRIKKNRPHKPFAVMFPNIEFIKKDLEVNDFEEKLLTSKEKPIVLLNKKNETKLLKTISPDTTKIGAFLPYSPLQVLLFKYLNKPIIATSANLKGEPIIRDLDDVVSKISNIVDYIVDFNRDILNFSDDSVLSVIKTKNENKILNIRNSRGFAPTIIKLPKKINKNILAMGANQKSNIALAFEDNVIISPYIGDLNSLESIDALKRTIKTFEKFYDFKPDIIVCDKHPNYESTKLAIELSNELEIPLLKIQHHKAHILSTILEFDIKEEVLGICFDGTGYGDDENLWGGEFLIGNSSNLKRIGHFEYFKLLGGEIAVKEPRRIALSLLFDNYSLEEVLKLNNPCVKAFSAFEIKTLHKAWENTLNSPLSSSVGRIFDAVASLSGLNQKQTYEGQTGILIEEFYDKTIKSIYSYEIKENGIIDISMMIKEIINESNKALICSKFLNTLVDIMYKKIKVYGKTVIFSGGVFQNKTLLDLIVQKLEKEKIKYFFSSKVPLNDGGISLGQIKHCINNLDI